MQPADFLAVILVLAASIGVINHLWIKLPPAIGMLVCSLVLSFAAIAADRLLHLHVMGWFRGTINQVELSRIFLNGALALMLFAGSLHVDARQLTRRSGMILLLATASVVLSTLLFGAGTWLVFGTAGIAVPIAWCFILGAILAPTDAVVVAAQLRQTSLPAELRAAIVGESLFNDGAAVALFLIALRYAKGESTLIGGGHIAATLISEIAGGAAIGLAGGAVAAAVVRRVSDEGLQLMISLALCLGSYRLANVANVSGPIAVVVAGLCVAARAPQFARANGTRSTLVAFWSLLDQLLNGMLFLLMGLQILAFTVLPIELLPVFLAIPLSLAARAISVALPALLTRESLREKTRGITVLTWAGLRGGISLALALTMPPSLWRPLLLTIVYAVVIFSVVIQGLTLPWLLRRVYGASAGDGVHSS
jgi:CPA1 family monovalent cation:H+ antiporter